ncbi:MAG: hypothetical protein XD36_0321 [Halomonas sp. 54_146]|nr:MAG: hypothetical protein XD36_0321 [Halomonas sp. 54_146]HAA46397.1 hypothetical protein [Halomonas sp.]
MGRLFFAWNLAMQCLASVGTRCAGARCIGTKKTNARFKEALAVEDMLIVESALVSGYPSLTL